MFAIFVENIQHSVLVLLFVALVYSTRRFVLMFAWCCFVLVFFGPLSNAITSLWEERANLSAFRAFVRFVLILVLSFSSSSWCLGRAAVCDCGTPRTFLLPFVLIKRSLRFSFFCVFFLSKDNFLAFFIFCLLFTPTHFL